MGHSKHTLKPVGGRMPENNAKKRGRKLLMLSADIPFTDSASKHDEAYSDAVKNKNGR